MQYVWSATRRRRESCQKFNHATSNHAKPGLIVGEIALTPSRHFEGENNGHRAICAHPRNRLGDSVDVVSCGPVISPQL